MPGAARPGGLLARFRGQDMRTGGQSVRPDGIHLPPELSTCHGPGPGSFRPGRALMLREMREKCVFVSYCFSKNYKKLRETLRGAAGNLRVNLSLQVVVCKSVKCNLRKKRVKNQVTARAPARATRTRIYRRALSVCGVILSAARVPAAIRHLLSWPLGLLDSFVANQRKPRVYPCCYVLPRYA